MAADVYPHPHGVSSKNHRGLTASWPVAKHCAAICAFWRGVFSWVFFKKPRQTCDIWRQVWQLEVYQFFWLKRSVTWYQLMTCSALRGSSVSSSVHSHIIRDGQWLTSTRPRIVTAVFVHKKLFHYAPQQKIILKVTWLSGSCSWQGWWMTYLPLFFSTADPPTTVSLLFVTQTMKKIKL